MSTLEELNQEIAELKEEIEEYKEERKVATSEERKDKFLDLINTCRQNLERLYTQLEREQQQQQQ